MKTKNCTPEDVIKIMEQRGTPVSKKQATDILDFLKTMADATVANYLKKLHANREKVHAD